jgi:hypothetical protein
MILSTLFWIILGIIVLIIATAISVVLRRQGRDGDRQTQDDSSPIYASGVYSLIRRSPRKELQEREPSLEEAITVLSTPQASAIANGSVQQYLDEWRTIANISINNIEKGDKEGIQTYKYQVPAKCQQTCAMFGGDAYVTREQLHNHVQLIPPFHLGCGVQLLTKEAWNAGSENAAWTPILPVNGKYLTPDWRSVVKL